MGFSDRPARQAHRRDYGSRDAKTPQPRRAAGVQAHRHLRRRVRFAHGLHVFDLRRAVRRPRRRRSGAVRQEEGRHPRRRPEPHRPGHRVRLLLLPRRLRAQGRRLRNHHGQLQSGDGVDRLRHFGPALFRAADRRGRARDHRHRTLERHLAWRHRAVRRPDAAQARRAAGKGATCRSSAPRPTPSISPRIATASSNCSIGSSCGSRRAASPPAPRRRAPSPRRSAIRS